MIILTYNTNILFILFYYKEKEKTSKRVTAYGKY